MSKNRYSDSINKVRFSKSFDAETVSAMEKASAGKAKRAKWLYAALPVACAAVVCVCLALGEVFAPTKPPKTATEVEATEPPRISSLLLSINPSIEFTVNEHGGLLEVKGANEDGIALIEGVDFSGLSFENAAIVVVNKLIEQNYITVLDIEKTASLSLAGDDCRTELIDVMSEVIRTAAEPYGIMLDTVQTDEDSVEIVLAAQKPELPEGALPAADPQALPTYMQIDYELTGIINTPSDIGWAGIGEERCFRMGYAEVSDIYLTIDGGTRYTASEIVNFDTAGDWLSTSTLQCMHSLITKGYITDAMPGKVVVTLNNSAEQQRQSFAKLADLILREAGLSLHAELTESGNIEIVPAEQNTEPAARYTMSELMDVRINKDREDITDLQMEIFNRAYTPDLAEERLKTRRFAVVPNLVGLSEDEAVALCRKCGFENIKVSYEQLWWYEQDGDNAEIEVSAEDIGKVIWPNHIAGIAMDVTMPVGICVLKNDEQYTEQPLENDIIYASPAEDEREPTASSGISYTLAPNEFDIGSMDIDGDGIEENYVIRFGPTSGLFTFEIEARAYGMLKYRSIFNTKYYRELKLSHNDSGEVILTATDGDLNKETFSVLVKGDFFVLADADGVFLEYWGPQGIEYGN